MQDTIDHVIPEELDYLRRYDQMTAVINEIVSLPDHKVDLMIKMLRQNHGILSKNKKAKFFDELSNKDVETIERRYQQEFGTQ